MWSTYAFSTKLIEYKFSIIYNYPSKIYIYFYKEINRSLRVAYIVGQFGFLDGLF